MPTRNCETRPISWKTHRNKALADAVIKIGQHYGDMKKGFIVWPVWMGFLTHRDNVGYFDGAPGMLRDSFFPHHPEITPEEVRVARDVLHEVGLIIVYSVNNIEYVLVPKVSNWSRLVGNISDKTDFPVPPDDVIMEWEQRFNEVYTPLIRRSNGVYTPYEQRIYGVSTESKSKSKSKSKIESKNYIAGIEKFFSHVEQGWLKTLQAAFPKADLSAELKKMKAWLVSNPGKPKKNIKRFAVNWLSRNKLQLSKTESVPGQDLDIDQIIEDRLGRIATKDMIKKLLQEISQGAWWKVNQYLRKRYPGSSGRDFEAAQRELIAEARQGKDFVSGLAAGIGKKG